MDNVMVLVMAAREYYDQDLPFPVDLYMELSREGVEPEQLEKLFEAGVTTEDIVYSYYD